MKDETKFLIEIADKFGKDAQSILDFVTKTGNLEKAAKVLNKAKSNEDLPDGIYFIAENHANYRKPEC